MNRLAQLINYGQSFWYDNIRRLYLQDGTLQTLRDQDGMRGLTSNPSIFDKAIAGSDDYDEQISELAAQDLETEAIYEGLALADIRAACDLFADLYQSSQKQDGYVSLEVSPHLADNTAGTVAAARRLFAAVNRPNLMIKVPATPAGIPAIRQLISAGINVNATLMFSMAHYDAVVGAFLDGLGERQAAGLPLGGIASVASFFVSRVDSAVDKQLAAIDDPRAAALAGKAAVANAKLVYQRYLDLVQTERVKRLRAAGAQMQRLLWASTSTKNPNYPDTLYVDELIGLETVNTMPPQTVDAFRDHGRLATTLTDDLAAARQVMAELATLGVEMDVVTEKLQLDGVDAFSRSFDQLLAAVEQKQKSLAAE